MQTDGVVSVRAVVRAIEGDEALLEVSHGCGRCHEEGGCGGQSLTQMFCGTPKRYRAALVPGVGINDQVILAVPEGTVRRTANQAYMIPLALLLAGAFLGNGVAQDAGAMAGALAGLLLGLWRLRRSRPGGAGNGGVHPHIVGRYFPGEKESCP